MSGDVIGLAPIDAVMVLESGRAELIDPKDVAVLKHATAAATKAALARPFRDVSSGPRGCWV